MLITKQTHFVQIKFNFFKTMDVFEFAHLGVRLFLLNSFVVLLSVQFFEYFHEEFQTWSV